MRLRLKTALVILAAALGMVLFSEAIVMGFVTAAIDKAEDAQAKEAISRVKGNLDMLIRGIDATCSDWAA
jgi:sensor domain CHASE-containing protein